MPTLYQNCLCTQSQEPPCGGIADFRRQSRGCSQLAQLRHIRSHQVAQWQEFREQQITPLGIQQRNAAGRGQDRIEYHIGGGIFTQGSSHDADLIRPAEHPDFHSCKFTVTKNCFHLGRQHVTCNRMHALNSETILHGQSCNHGNSDDAQGGESPQVSLNSRPAAGIGTGNC